MQVSLSFQWKGCGGLRASVGTTSDQALQNQVIAGQICNLPNIRQYFGTHDIPGKGVLAIDYNYVRDQISKRLTELRRPNYNQVHLNSIFYDVFYAKHILC